MLSCIVSPTTTQHHARMCKCMIVHVTHMQELQPLVGGATSAAAMSADSGHLALASQVSSAQILSALTTKIVFKKVRWPLVVTVMTVVFALQ